MKRKAAKKAAKRITNRRVSWDEFMELASTAETLAGDVAVMRERIDRAGLADLRAHLDGLAKRVAAIEGLAATTSVNVPNRITVKHPPGSILPNSAPPTATPEPAIPEGWKRTTKKEAKKTYGVYYGFWREKNRYDQWNGPDSMSGNNPHCEYIYLARDLPELPEALRTHWTACDESEAWPMGVDSVGDPAFAAWESRYSYRFPVGMNKPFPKGTVPIRPRRES